MAYVIAAPEMMTAAATDLATIGSDLAAAHTAAAASTVHVIPAAADEVSASVAHLFSHYGGGFQALAGQAAAFHGQLVQNLKASAFSYTKIEAALTALLHGDLLDWLYSQYGVPAVVNVLADVELAILLVTSPLWIPLLIILSPLILLLVIFLGVLAAA